MPYNSETSAYERRAATVIDATPDGDTVAIAIDVKLDQGIDDYVTDLNHHDANGNHYPATSVGSDSRFLKQSPAGVVSWADGVVAADAALKDFSNVADGAITSAKLASVAPAKVAQNASNRFVTDAEKSTWNGALYDKSDVEAILTGTITSHTHSAASESAAGLVELATAIEAAADDTSRAVTGAGVTAAIKAKLNATGDAPMAACRAWVQFDGGPASITPNGSLNVSSVTKTATGRYIINFETALPDSNYAAVFSSRITLGSNVSGCVAEVSGAFGTAIRTTSALYIVIMDSTSGATDSSSISVAIFR